LLHFVGTC